MLRSRVQYFLLALLSSAFCGAECIPVTDATNHIGEVHCVTGKVVRVGRGNGGITYFDFCENHLACPFSAVIFSHDLKSIGDVRQLAGRVIEIHGPVKGYDGHAEIIVQESRQLGGDGARIPPLPKSYDVEQRGHYSAGNIRRPKRAYTVYPKKHPAKTPIDVPIDEGDTEENEGVH
ncbi:MAG TPA: hypothetical protein VFA74_20395 [Terriglobales bacterium]|nr:hypothetical protein [Terriglobales bacterium]